jgi:hypothetical protein
VLGGRPIQYFLLGEVYYQEQVAKRIKNSLTRITEPSGQVILRRPYHIGWFTNQVSMCVFCCCAILFSFLIRFGSGCIFFRCLALWEGDRDLFRALELAKSFLAPTEVLNSLWPCQGTFSFSMFCYRFSEGSFFVYMYVMHSCTHSLPLARQGATGEAFSGLCNCRHTAPITPSNTGLCCFTAPSSHGHHQSGDFFPVNNSRPYRGALFLLPFTCLHFLELFVYDLFFLFLSCRRVMFAVDYCSLYIDSLRLIWEF